MFWNHSRHRKLPSKDQKTISRKTRPSLHYRVGNIQGIGDRPYQEDSFSFVNAESEIEWKRHGMMILLADGMGGMKNGKAISEMAIQEMRLAFQEMDLENDIASQLSDSIQAINSNLFQKFHGESGTTFIVAIIYRESLWFSSVGDSYLYLMRGGGMYRLNCSQNHLRRLYSEQLHSGHLQPELAREDEDGDRLSEYVGSRDIGELDALIRPFPLYDGDTLLICSDGVGGVLSPQVLAGCLEHISPMESCKIIEEKIKEQKRRYQDNYTALVVSCSYD